MGGRGSGRPSKLDEDIFKIAVEYAAKVPTKKAVADACGIKASTITDWIVRGEKDIEDGNPTIFGRFSVAFKESRAKLRLSRLKIIRAAAESGSWQAAGWELERTFPSEYGRYDRREEEEVDVGGSPKRRLVLTVKSADDVESRD